MQQKSETFGNNPLTEACKGRKMASFSEIEFTVEGKLNSADCCFSKCYKAQTAQQLDGRLNTDSDQMEQSTWSWLDRVLSPHLCLVRRRQTGTNASCVVIPRDRLSVERACVPHKQCCAAIMLAILGGAGLDVKKLGLPVSSFHQRLKPRHTASGLTVDGDIWR